MSRKSSASRKRRRRDARQLLGRVAAALNACEAAGIRIRLKHGAVLTREGYVLPLGEHRWAARTLIYTEFSGEAGGDDDD